MDNEKWATCIETDSKYEVSNLGRIRHIQNGTYPKYIIRMWGYHSFCCRYKNKSKKFDVHRLVASYHVLNPEGKPQVNHIDGNKLNNTASNLEWCTHQENMDHAKKLGLFRSPKHWTGKTGKNCPNSKPVILTDIKTGEEKRFDSLTLAGEYIGAGRQDIYKCIKRNGQTKNYTARYEYGTNN